MAATFVDIAQSCAPMVQVETLAGVVSLESKFRPFAIRINSGEPLPSQPASKAEAIELATSLIAEHQDIQIGLGGIGAEELRKLNLSVSNAFDPCQNLKATATLLDSYYRLALRVGAGPAQAEKVMLQSYYGRSDPSVGAMVKYDEQVRREAKRLSAQLGTLMLAERSQPESVAIPPSDQSTGADPSHASPTEETASWDVFNSGRHSPALVFQNNSSEQSQ